MKKVGLYGRARAEVISACFSCLQHISCMYMLLPGWKGQLLSGEVESVFSQLLSFLLTVRFLYLCVCWRAEQDALGDIAAKVL